MKGCKQVSDFKKILSKLQGARIHQVLAHQDVSSALYAVTIVTADGYMATIGWVRGFPWVCQSNINTREVIK